MKILNSLKEDKVLFSFLLLTIFIGVGLSATSFFIDNSYGWDELFSIVAAKQSLANMFNMCIFPDVYPPLHFIILKIWISILGTTEIATRMLSFIFAIGALVLLFLWILKRFDVHLAIPVILFFVSSWMFSYYAQENRAYSLMLLFSTISTILFVDLLQKNFKTSKLIIFLTTIIFLSLTHYFGLIYGGLLLIISFFLISQKKYKILIIISGLICLFWPLIHFFYGNLGHKTGGNFWIKSKGVQTTLTAFINSLLPQSYVLEIIIGENLKEIFTAVLTVILFVLIYFVFLKDTKKQEADKYFFTIKMLSVTLTTFIIIISLIDLYSPISLTHHFVVILPLFSLIFGFIIFSLRNKKRFYYSILVLVIISMFIYTFKRVISKVTPIQNHKACVEFIIKKRLYESHTIYYLAKDLYPEKIYHDMAYFYFEKYNIKDSIKIYPKAFKDLETLEPPFVYFTQHKKIEPIEVINFFKKKNIYVNFYEPKQAGKNSTLVFYTE